MKLSGISGSCLSSSPLVVQFFRYGRPIARCLIIRPIIRRRYSIKVTGKGGNAELGSESRTIFHYIPRRLRYPVSVSSVLAFAIYTGTADLNLTDTAEQISSRRRRVAARSIPGTGEERTRWERQEDGGWERGEALFNWKKVNSRCRHQKGNQTGRTLPRAEQRVISQRRTACGARRVAALSIL
jgi:hypothetical protein